MTKKEFQQKLEGLRQQTMELSSEALDMLPSCVKEETWVVEGDYGVPLHIFGFMATTFANNLDELQNWFI